MNKFFTVLCSAAVCLLTSCTTARMALTNQAWSNNAGYPVEGRTQTVLQKKPLKFAEFYTSQVKTSWKQSSVRTTDMDGRLTERINKTIGILSQKSKSSRRLSLSNGQGQEALVLTFNKLNTSGYLMGGGVELNLNWINKNLGIPSKTENSYYVQVYEPDNDKPWEMVLDMDAVDMNPKNYAGYFALDEQQYYTIRPVRHLMGKTGPMKMPVGLVGFEIYNTAGDPVAAVSVFDKGLVYLQDKLLPPERFLIADLCAALLLYEPNEVTR